jgi:hypothetical protein
MLPVEKGMALLRGDHAESTPREGPEKAMMLTDSFPSPVGDHQSLTTTMEALNLTPCGNSVALAGSVSLQAR